jgi:hypothetical protein
MPQLSEIDYVSIFASIVVFLPSLLPIYLLLSLLAPSPPLTPTKMYGMVKEQQNGCPSTHPNSQEVDA